VTADWDTIGQHLRAVAEHGDRAWPELQTALHGEVLRLARFQPIGRLRSDVDAPHEILRRVLSRLHANDYRAIKKLYVSDQPPQVGAWIRVLVRSAAIDFMREHTEYIRSAPGRDSGWISLHSLVSSDGTPHNNSLVEKQREVERFVTRMLEQAQAAHADTGDDAVSALAIAWKVEPLHARRLLKKGAHYLPVLRLVLAGHSYPHVAQTLGITRREVELLVSYVEEFLHACGFAAS
jgi:DNA-directed RNA polymerase specialized sigma24 family protein